MERIPPKKIALQLTRILKKQRPDANYVKKVFQHVRLELGLKGGSLKAKKLPELLTEQELIRFYEAVWNAMDRTHVVMIKLLIFTGIRNSELANLRLEDVDLNGLKIRINEGKGKRDRYVPIPSTFRGELAQYMDNQKRRRASYLCETNRQDKFSTRWIRGVIKRYALQAGIEKRVYPHLFRHQFLTYLAQKGILDAKVQIISGHQDRKSLAIYQEMSLADVEQEYQAAMRDFPVK
ncbi:tyrosine-type recombinase/integrase [Thermodesulfobacteriota bacterium]